MRRFILAAGFALCSTALYAQVDTTVTITTNSVETFRAPKFKPISRAGDHLMLQLAYNTWQGAPDSVSSRISGFQRSANIYAMFDKPFKANPQLSVAVGAGIGVSNIYFKNMEANIISRNRQLPFINTDGGPNFKKYKVMTTYFEVPVEFRFMASPENPNRGFKMAIGGKVGTLLSAGTKGKTLQNNANGTTINDYTQKIKSNNYFTGTRITGTARVGYGNFGLFGAYSFSPVFKDGVAADINLLQFGISLSGL